MMNIEVSMGELVVTKEEGSLYSHAVGSCVVITLYEHRLKIAGMIHAMLPSRTLESEVRMTNDEVRYVDIAIDSALEKMFALGADRKNIEAKLAGGANMFGFSYDIGAENVKSAREKLKQENIKIVGESVGGSIGRSVEFSTAAGIVTVKIVI